VGYHERVKKLGRVEVTAEEVDARLEEMGRKMDRLRVLYENFFMGIDRTPPNVPRRDLNRLILEMQQTPIKNATMRFRFQTLQQRWVLMTTYWNRTLREIEMGTYRRDLDRANRHMAAKGGAHNQQAARAVSASSASTPAAPRPAAAPQALPGLRDGALEDFYQRYVKAHTDAVGAPPKASLEQMRAKLQQDLPKILAQQNCARVELDVAVDGGKVRLRARPVK
jgi:hypothetical protein